MTGAGALRSGAERDLSEAGLSELSAYVAARLGLRFSRDKWTTLQQGAWAAAREAGFEHPERYLRSLLSSPAPREQIEMLARHLTVGETYFFREPRSLELLEEEILPELVWKRWGREQSLKIWSAGCATGEEPYSIAAVLKAMESLRGWKVSILATDVNPEALRRAREGIYTSWSFRCAPKGFRERYFTAVGGGRFEISPEVRKLVSFSWLNLAEPCYPLPGENTDRVDVIFCRNVLMYFTPEAAKDVIRRLHGCLVEGGWLAVAPCEVSQPLLRRFEPVNFGEAVLYRKRRAGERGARPNRSPADAPALSPLRSPRPSRADTPPPAEPRVRDAREFALRCRSLADQGRLTEALEASEGALALDKMNPGLHYLRATILQELGALAEAESSLKRALYLDRDLVLAHISLAHLAWRQGKANAARKHFENALGLLAGYGQAEVIPESEGMLAGRLVEMIRSTDVMKERG
ncbi:MAG: chemotaxis protein CheR [Deltaproteobacteria bacterium]|nr:chemotaxis protein CheR [Deltaproteobacteria bacterium]